MAKKKGNGNAMGNPMAVMQAMLKQWQSGAGAGNAGGGAGKHEKIKGTQIKQVKGGGFVRVVTEDGKEFPITASKAVYKHLKSIGQEVVKQPNPPQKQGGKKAMKKQKERKERTPEEEEAHKQKQTERHEAMVEKEGRVMAGPNYIKGEIVRRGSNFMWVKPDSANSIPASVRDKLQTMNDEFRAKGGEGKKAFLGGETENVVYVRLADISEDSLSIKPETKVKFKLYTDNKGVGGCEVVSA